MHPGYVGKDRGLIAPSGNVSETCERPRTVVCVGLMAGMATTRSGGKSALGQASFRSNWQSQMESIENELARKAPNFDGGRVEDSNGKQAESPAGIRAVFTGSPKMASQVPVVQASMQARHWRNKDGSGPEHATAGEGFNQRSKLEASGSGPTDARTQRRDVKADHNVKAEDRRSSREPLQSESTPASLDVAQVIRLPETTIGPANSAEPLPQNAAQSSLKLKQPAWMGSTFEVGTAVETSKSKSESDHAQAGTTTKADSGECTRTAAAGQPLDSAADASSLEKELGTRETLAPSAASHISAHRPEEAALPTKGVAVEIPVTLSDESTKATDSTIPEVPRTIVQGSVAREQGQEIRDVSAGGLRASAVADREGEGLATSHSIRAVQQAHAIPAASSTAKVTRGAPPSEGGKELSRSVPGSTARRMREASSTASGSAPERQAEQHEIIGGEIVDDEHASVPIEIRTGSLAVDSALPGATTHRTASDIFTAMDAPVEGGRTQWTHVSPKRAEATFDDPALGVIGVRAEKRGAEVVATLVIGSSRASEELHGQISSLTDYLAAQHTKVGEVTVANLEPRHAGRVNGESSEFGGSTSGSAHQHNGQNARRQNDGGEPPATTEHRGQANRSASSGVGVNQVATDSAVRGVEQRTLNPGPVTAEAIGENVTAEHISVIA